MKYLILFFIIFCIPDYIGCQPNDSKWISSTPSSLSLIDLLSPPNDFEFGNQDVEINSPVLKDLTKGIDYSYEERVDLNGNSRMVARIHSSDEQDLYKAERQIIRLSTEHLSKQGSIFEYHFGKSSSAKFMAEIGGKIANVPNPYIAGAGVLMDMGGSLIQWSNMNDPYSILKRKRGEERIKANDDKYEKEIIEMISTECRKSQKCIKDFETKIVEGESLSKNPRLQARLKAKIPELLRQASEYDSKMDQKREEAELEAISRNVSGLGKKVDAVAETAAYALYLTKSNEIAIRNLDSTIRSNFTAVNSRFDNIDFVLKDLQESGDRIELKLDTLSEAFFGFADENKLDKLMDKFANSPLRERLKQLKDTNSLIYHNITDSVRIKLIKNYEIAAQKEDFLKAANFVTQYGPVAIEFFKLANFPPEISQGIQYGIIASNIAGAILTQNYSAAIMAGLGLFKKPSPGPEMQMLNKISMQLENLDKKIDKRFLNVQNQIYDLSMYLTDRMSFIDHNIEITYNSLVDFRKEALIKLGTINNKLDYIIKQNDCLYSVVQKNNPEHFEICSDLFIRWSEFLNAHLQTEISLSDISDFIQIGGYYECLDKYLGYNPINSINTSFEYSECEEDTKQPIRIKEMYSYLYKLINSEDFADSNSVNQAYLLFEPKNVKVASNFGDLLKPYLNGPKFETIKSDENYRNYLNVIGFIRYYLKLLPLIEIYDESKRGILGNEERMKIATGRLNILLNTLKNTLILVDHTLLQQNILSGNGVIKKIEANLIDKIDIEATTNILLCNPQLNKNFGSYLIDKKIGYTKLSKMVSDLSMNNETNIVQTIYDPKSNIKYIIQKLNNSRFTIELMHTGTVISRLYLPTNYNFLSQESYNYFLEFSVPNSIKMLKEGRLQVEKKIQELEFVLLPSLDDTNSVFTRTDLVKFISSLK